MSNQEILEKAIRKAVEGYEGIYEITRHGDVVSTKYGYVLKKYIDRKGYWRVSLNKKVDGKWKSQQVLVHRLLAKAYIPNPKGLPTVNHTNGVRDDNTLTNLEWCTQSYNVKDGFNRGRVAWNKDLKSTQNMDLKDLAKELPRLQELAKALWGEASEKCICGKTIDQAHSALGRHGINSGWQHHLKEMVVADDPIKYLGENLSE